jgi:hypothetical protein
MKMKKSITALLLTTIFLVSAFAPLIYTNSVQGDAASDYHTVSGVLGTDTYTLYPYAANSLTVGFSKYGELIDGNTKTGLSYNGTDPFAPAGGSPPEYQWIEGWVLNVTYVEGGLYKNLWALATYSDYQDALGIGGSWQEGVTVGSLDLSVRGGRKTSGGAITDPIQPLYDGPREYVAVCHTTIYEAKDHVSPLLSLTFTIDFNKVSKEVVIFKDVKRIDTGKNIGEVQVEFGDRGEWDLGSGTPPKSYGKVYTAVDTVYDHNWQPWYNNSLPGYDGTYDVAQIIDSGLNYSGYVAFWPRPISTWIGATQGGDASRPVILTSLSTITEDLIANGTKWWFTPTKGTPYAYPQNGPAGVVWSEDPMVFATTSNGLQSFTVNSTDHTTGCIYFPGNHTVVFYPEDVPTGIVRLVYKVNKTKTEMSSEPDSPFVIGEWCFEMDSAPEIFRGVTAYGLTDRHDADDQDRVGNPYYHSSQGDVIDMEVHYQLDQTFNPWDLQSAIEKKTSRWVEFPTFGSSSYTTIHRPVIDVNEYMWTQYNQMIEKVEDLNTSTILHRYENTPLQGSLEDYDFYVDSNGYGQFTGLNTTHLYKITYSTYNTITSAFEIDDGPTGWSTYYNSTTGTPITFWYNNTLENSTYATSSPFSYTFTDNLGAQQQFSFSFSHATTMISNSTTSTNGSIEVKGSLPFNITNIKVWKENTARLNLLKISPTQSVPPPYGDDSFHDIATDGNATIDLSKLALNWTITPPLLTDLHIDSANITLSYDITLSYWRNSTYWNWSTSYIYYVQAMITEHVPGRWEWGVLGQNTASVDSAGLSMVSAAFKNKQVEYGLAGEDMYNSNVANQMPWVMSQTSQGTSWANYYYGPSDFRTGLRDDWCTTWPITTSNMIGVGGPLSNMFSYYGNDFASALWGDQFASGVWAGNIGIVSCWNKNRSATIPYTSTNTAGYGVISTFEDPNGTIGLLLWGVWGRDTYYLTKWFHEDGIYELQQAPPGLTSIVVKINYKSYPEGYKPTSFSVVECLGTISERLWTGVDVFGNYFVKGGIHDP